MLSLFFIRKRDMADYPIIFTRQLKDQLGIEPEYTAQDNRLALAINTASRTIESLLGRKLTRATHEEYVATKRNVLKGYDIYGVSDSGYYGQYKTVPLYLKNFPVDTTADFDVFYDPTERYALDTKLDSSEYILDAERGVLIIKKAVNDYKRGLKVVYTAGYTPTVDTDNGVVEDDSSPQEKALANSVPVDLVQATIWQAAVVYEKQYSGNLNVSQSRGEGSTNTANYVNRAGISPEAMAIVSQNKRPRYMVI